MSYIGKTLDYVMTKWRDHVEDDQGQVIQNGTPIDQGHMSKIEQGIFEITAAVAEYWWYIKAFFGWIGKTSTIIETETSTVLTETYSTGVYEVTTWGESGNISIVLHNADGTSIMEKSVVFTNDGNTITEEITKFPTGGES